PAAPPRKEDKETLLVIKERLKEIRKMID
ncbi:MAG: hypothetical protein H6Q50_371, partial [Deltaproteobacteria bacterium]|nr:hypothetical protein [Deltaproteobacteria bacterium]